MSNTQVATQSAMTSQKTVTMIFQRLSVVSLIQGRNKTEQRRKYFSVRTCLQTKPEHTIFSLESLPIYYINLQHTAPRPPLSLDSRQARKREKIEKEDKEKNRKEITGKVRKV